MPCGAIVWSKIGRSRLYYNMAMHHPHCRKCQFLRSHPAVDPETITVAAFSISSTERYMIGVVRPGGLADQPLVLGILERKA